ncbi:nucleotide exchange factor GrpE [Planomonospora venezuelensis]|uniref:GrpE protein n=1 Tax=Planomonospora venezuelensis TaxID=1999 RepID=A0A841CYB8_PLAVE|nr:nucleotide exchange factor GrpE [Planomonospora venezuelensis]MBB5963382.1 hypothetical protein [Planomonospora venezuelensis]GIN05728.1 hypothetical protein Pve01_73860 [Planomonospora venezuelensis]
MRDRRALLPLLLLGGLALAGCGSVAGSGGNAAGAGGDAVTAVTQPAPAPAETSGGGVGRLLPRGEDGVAQTPGGAGAAQPSGEAGRGGEKPAGESGAPEEPGPFGLPLLPLLLALGAAAVAAIAAGVLLWRRNAGASSPAAWQAGPVPPEPAGPAAPQAGAPMPVPPAGAPAPAAPPTAQSAMPPTAPPSPAAPSGPPARSSGASAPPGSPAPSGDPMPSAQPAVPDGDPAPAASDPLKDVLEEVAGSGISQALTQQVERLFAGGRPSREALVEACIGCRDQIAERHPRLADRLLAGLNRAGVREIVADGQRFDPRLHEAFGTEPTDRPELHDIVAETVKHGYADGDRVVRVPQVAVYRHEPAAVPDSDGAGR